MDGSNEIQRLRKELRIYQIEDLRRRMLAWLAKNWFTYSGDTSGGGCGHLIWWVACEYDSADTTIDAEAKAVINAAIPGAKAVVEFGRSIDAWITDDGNVVTIAEWEQQRSIQLAQHR